MAYVSGGTPWKSYFRIKRGSEKKSLHAGNAVVAHFTASASLDDLFRSVGLIYDGNRLDMDDQQMSAEEACVLTDMLTAIAPYVARGSRFHFTYDGEYQKYYFNGKTVTMRFGDED